MFYYLSHNIAVARAVRAGARREAASVRADQAGAVLRGHLGQARVGAAPGVVQQVRAGLRDHLADLGAPRVDADHDVGVPLAHGGDQARHPVDLLRRGHLVAGPRLDPADVDDVRAVGDRAADRVKGGGEAGIALEERIRRPVDHPHDPELSAIPLAGTELQRPGLHAPEAIAPPPCGKT
jgi:hypothetical protein